jgi:hypothetical protein
MDDDEDDVAGECVDEDIIILLCVISDLVERRITSS